ncbi:MAG: PEP-CTERM sorting domain-containing protein [Puniceicoccales bacterium]|jgi:autotransporter-associated beta strand protein|nr:PEP-CTERM sorting domain-containing protein [Puniceicoccales bacterium]
MKTQSSRASLTRTARVFALPRRVLVAAALLALGTAPSASAAIHTFTGAASDPTLWADPANWLPAAVPNSNADSASFDLGAYPTLAGKIISLGTARTISELSATGLNTEGNYSLAIGTSAADGSLIFDNGVSPATISLTQNLSLLFNAPVSVASASGLTVGNASALGGSITFAALLDSSGNPLFINTAATAAKVTLTSLSAGGILSKTGAGSLVFSASGTSSFTAGSLVNFNGGNIALFRDDALGNTASATSLQLDGSSSLSFSINASRTLHQSNYQFANTTLALTLDASAPIGQHTLTLHGNSSFFNGSGYTLALDPNTTLAFAAGNILSGGTLSKIGGGTLSFSNPNSNFSSLAVSAGFLTATLAPDTTTYIGNDSAGGIFGKGNVTISGAATQASLSGGNNSTLIFSGNTLKLENGAPFTVTNTAVVFSAGTVDFSSANSFFTIDAPATLGATTFSNAANATLRLSQNITFTANDIPSSGVKFELSNTDAQVLSFSPATGAVALAGSLVKTGSGTTTLAASINTFSAASLTLSTGTFALSAANQLSSATPLSFVSPTSSPAKISLSGYNQSLGALSIANNASATFHLGGNSSSTTSLSFSSVNNAGILRIENWAGGASADVVKIISSVNLNTNNVWFYGYNKGAARDSATGTITPANGLLVSSFDNKNDSTGFLGDWKWGNPLSWGGDDIYSIPNSPGATAKFDSNIHSALLPGINTIRLDNSTFTIGHLVFDSSLNTGTYFHIGVNGISSKIIFDSGSPGVPATIIEAAVPATNPRIFSDMELRSDLIIDTSRYFWPSGGLTISESGGSYSITKKGAGNLYLMDTQVEITGGIILEKGTISLSASTSLGTSPITIKANSDTKAIRGYNAQFATLKNPLVIEENASFRLSAIKFAPSTPTNVVLTGTQNRIYSDILVTAEVYASISFGTNFNFTGTGALTLQANGQTGYGFTFSGANSNFSGGLTSEAARIVIGATGDVVLGAEAPGKNYLGTGDITLTNNGFVEIQTTGGNVSLENGMTVTLNGGSLRPFLRTTTILKSGSLITGNSSGFVAFSGNAVFDGGIIEKVRVTSSASMDAAVPAGGLTISATGASLGQNIVFGRRFDKDGPNRTTIESSVQSFSTESGLISMNTGTLRLTKDNQILDAKPSDGDHVLVGLYGGALDVNGHSLNLENYGILIAGGSGSILLGDGGNITFFLKSASYAADASLLIQNASGTWAGLGNNDEWAGDPDSDSFIRFAYHGGTNLFTQTQLDNITFSGYEPGAELSARTNGYYYLAPSGVLTNEWFGTSGSDWSTATNWSGGSIPQSGNTTSVSFRDGDPNLNGKTITINSAVTLNRINFSTTATEFTLAGSGAGKLIFDGLEPRINHSGSGTVVINVPVQLSVDTILNDNVGNTVGYINWTGPISGSGKLIKTGVGTLRMSGDSTAWTGGLVWESGELEIMGGAASLGAGIWKIGTGQTNKLFIKSVSGDRSISAPFELNVADFIFQRATGIGSTPENSSRTLTLSGNGTLSAGNHRISSYANVFYRSSARNVVLNLVFDGKLSGPGGIIISPNAVESLDKLDSAAYGNITFNKTNDFTGDFIFDMSGAAVTANADNALGVGTIKLYGGDLGNSLLSGGSTIHVLSNKLEFPSTGNASLCIGNIKFDYSGVVTITGSHQWLISRTTIFGKNLVLAGTGSISLTHDPNNAVGVGTFRLEGNNTFSGGIALEGNNVPLLQIGHDNALGTGTFTVSAVNPFGAYSDTGTSITSRTISNNINIANTTVFAVDNSGDANTLILAGTDDFTLRGDAGTLQIRVAVNDTLRIEKKIVDAGASTPSGFTRSSGGASGVVELANGGNTFSGSLVTQNGVIRARAPTGDIVTGTAETGKNYFGTANKHFADGASATFHLKADAGDVYLRGAGEIYQLDNGAKLRSETPVGKATYLTGGTALTSITPANLGTLETTGPLLKTLDAGTTEIGVKITAPSLVISNGTIKTTAENLLSGVSALELSGGTLDINSQSQTLGGELYVTNDSVIDLGTAGTHASPTVFSVDAFNITSGKKISVLNWRGDTSTGLGETRIVTGQPIGLIIQGINLGSATDTAIVKINDYGEGVLFAFTNEFEWTGASGVNTNWNANGAGNVTNWIKPLTGENIVVPSGEDVLATFNSDNTTWNIASGSSLDVNLPFTGQVTLGHLAVTGNKVVTVTLNATGASDLVLRTAGTDAGVSISVSDKNTLVLNTPVTLAYEAGVSKNNLTINIVDAEGKLTINNPISGAFAGVTKTGAGILELNGVNTYSNGFTLDGGTVRITNNNAFGTGTLTLNKGTLELPVNNASVTLLNDYVLNGTPGDLLFVNKSQTNAALTLAGNGAFSGSAQTITIDTESTGKIIFGAVGGTSKSLASTTDPNATLTIAGAGVFGLAAALTETHTLRVDFVNSTAGQVLLSDTGYATFNAKLEVLTGKVVVKNTIGVSGDYNKDFVIGQGGTFQYGGASTQILSGKIMPDAAGKYGTVEMENTSGTLIVAGRGFTNPNPIFGSYYQKENPFQGNLSVKGGGTLQITGPLGSEKETFDGGSALEATYYHARYKGDMSITGGGTIEFAYNGDYQYANGAITGGGTLKINSGMPFYYAGNASGFFGTTIITGGSIFHLNVPAGQSYGLEYLRQQSFTVRSGSMLYVGGGGKVYTQSFVMEKNTTLVVNPGKFTIDATNAPVFGELPNNNITFAFRLASDDVDTFANPIPKLTITSASGTVVLYAGSTLRVDAFGYIPQPSQDGGQSYPGHFTLMSGLDTATMAASASVVGMDELALAIFGQNEFEILNGRFSLLFTDDGRLILDQTDYIGVPEPATYGLFSGVFIAAFALLRRRRRRVETTAQ